MKLLSYLIASIMASMTAAVAIGNGNSKREIDSVAAEKLPRKEINSFGWTKDIIEGRHDDDDEYEDWHTRIGKGTGKSKGTGKGTGKGKGNGKGSGSGCSAAGRGGSTITTPKRARRGEGHEEDNDDC